MQNSELEKINQELKRNERCIEDVSREIQSLQKDIEDERVVKDVFRLLIIRWDIV